MLNQPLIKKLPEAFKFLFEPARYKVAYGGRGCGKSHSFAEGFILSMIQETRPDPLYGCFREIQSSIDDSVKLLLMKKVKELNLSRFFYTRPTLREIRCLLNGGRFVFEGLKQNPTKITSMEGLLKLWLEEANVLSEESIDFLFPTVREPESEIWISFNPNKRTDYIYNLFVENEMPDSIVRKINYWDNPWFETTKGGALELERKRTKFMHPDKYKRIWLGEVGYSENVLIKREWWKFYDDRKHLLDKVITGMMITGDTAYKTGQMNDYTVLQLWGYDGKRVMYLLDQIRGKWEFPSLLLNAKRFYDRACSLTKRCKPKWLFIEDKASGTSLVQTLRSQGLPAEGWRPKNYNFPDDKIGRVQESAWLIYDGVIRLPKSAPWLKGLLDEIESVGEYKIDNAHDDQVDAMTMAIGVWRGYGGGLVKRKS